MGISGLLPLLSDATRPQHVKAYKGMVVAVDTYVWLHRGAFGCAEDLALNRPTDTYVRYCMRRVNMLLYYGIKPIMVFDGARLPMKSVTEESRRTSRESHRSAAAVHLAAGRRKAALECFQKSIDITPAMALRLIEALRKAGVAFVVAPYEADAQLAWLMHAGVADAVISEDSDLLVFGCQTVLFKMDDEGNGQEITLERVWSIGCINESSQLSSLSPAISFSAKHWATSGFILMAILSGCDYVASIPGIGIKTAYQIVRRYPTLDRALAHLRSLPKVRVPSGYDAAITRAFLTFRHQRVFSFHLNDGPIELVPLNPHPSVDDAIWKCDGVDVDLSFAGPAMDHERALEIARGIRDPETSLILCRSDMNLKTEIKVVAAPRIKRSTNASPMFKMKSPPTSGISKSRMWTPEHRPRNTIDRYFLPNSSATKSPFKPVGGDKPKGIEQSLMSPPIKKNSTKVKRPRQRPIAVVTSPYFPSASPISSSKLLKSPPLNDENAFDDSDENSLTYKPTDITTTPESPLSQSSLNVLSNTKPRLKVGLCKSSSDTKVANLSSSSEMSSSPAVGFFSRFKFSNSSSSSSR